MRKQFRPWLLGLLLVIISIPLLVAGCAASTGSSNQLPDSTITSAPIAAQSTVTNSAPAGVPQEGIKVHGNWTIEVINPDGTPAEHREFENSLFDNGPLVLASLLGRQNTTGGWGVELSGQQGAFLEGPNPTAGVLVENSPTSTGTNYFKTLTVDVPTSGPNAHKLVLTGNATASATGDISQVSTRVILLAPSLPPAIDYYDGTFFGFTSTSSFTPVNLTPGQQVQVTVVISFS